MKTFNNYVCESTDSPDQSVIKIGKRLAHSFCGVDAKQFRHSPYWCGICNEHTSKYTADKVVSFVKSALLGAGYSDASIDTRYNTVKNHDEAGMDKHFMFDCECKEGSVFVTIGLQSINDMDDIPSMVQFTVDMR